MQSASMVEFVGCLVDFALMEGSGPNHTEIVTQSVNILHSCAKLLIEEAERISSTPSTPQLSKKKLTFKQHLNSDEIFFGN